MNLNVYEKTRYQNIYRHKKNKNYVIMISKPVKSSIATMNGEKIYKLDEAVKIRDNPKIKLQKGAEINHKDDFDTLLDKYMDYCKYELKLSYNTLKKKRILYNKYFRGKFGKISKITKEELAHYIDSLSCSAKQKNEIIKIIKPFFYWCLKEEIIFKNPLFGIKLYRTTKSEMRYWLPENLKDILAVINKDIEEETDIQKYYAYLVKMIILIGFALGDRIGETRALRFIDINQEFLYITIKYSINYNPQDNNYLSTTKTKESEDKIFITEKLVSEILKYREFLENIMDFPVKDETPILFNFKTKKPYSDVRLRELFNYYIEKANVPKIRMYDLRHTVATTLMSENYDMYVIQNKLRHKSIKTTIDKYGHITINKRKEVAKITDKYI